LIRRPRPATIAARDQPRVHLLRLVPFLIGDHHDLALEVVQRTLSQGAFDYVAKPFNLARSRQVVEAAMEAGV
jgi:hypothetical protein